MDKELKHQDHSFLISLIMSSKVYQLKLKLKLNSFVQEFIYGYFEEAHGKETHCINFQKLMGSPT